jgi:putative Ca2+/H+ antiporter (TMEM165/GDT1 family)
MIFEGRIVVSLIMLALFAGMVGYAFTFPADARFLPWVIGIPGLLFCIGQLIIELRDRTTEERDPTERRRELKMFAWFVAFIVAILLFGFVYAGPVLVAAYLYFDWHERPIVVVTSAIVAFAVLFGIFEWALELRLFGGFLDRMLPF